MIDDFYIIFKKLSEKKKGKERGARRASWNDFFGYSSP
jgi:hypothetical protein